MATITVRQATPDDATELARLLDLFDRMGATPEQHQLPSCRGARDLMRAPRFASILAVLRQMAGWLAGRGGRRARR
jgi:hypothetical protein